MTEPFLRSYSQLLIQTCHRRGAHAMGGMAAQIPIKDDPEANAAALAKVEADKRREAADGHDGTWVAHPALVPVAKRIFDELMPEPNQLGRLREDVRVGRDELLAVPRGPITAAGLRHDAAVGLRYLAAWLAGSGCVPLYHLMEDAATAEISRAQLWQWVHHGARLEDGRTVDAELFRAVLREELARMAAEAAGRADAAPAEQRELAGRLFERMVTDDAFAEFLTLPAYEHILSLRNDR
jgi:malate synthase